MKFKKLAALSLVTVMSMATLSGCGGSSTTETANNEQQEAEVTDNAEADSKEDAAATGEAEAVNLKVWVPEEEMAITESMAASFQEAHPEFDITWDISVMGMDETTNALEGALNACSKDGLLYGIPSSPNCCFMYYNKSLFTVVEVKSLETMIAKDLGDGIQNFSCSISNSWYLEAFFYAAGCNVFGPDGTDPDVCDWNSENGVAVENYVIDLANNPKYLEDKDGIAASMFKEGKLGAMCSGTWDAPALKEALGDDFGAVALPTININGKDTNLSNFADYRCFSVKSNTQAPLAAQLFAEWCANEENQLTRYVECGVSPACMTLQQNPVVAEDVATCALIAQTEYATPQPAISQINEYWTPVATLGEGIINKDITKDNVQEKLDAVVEAITSKLVE